MAEHIRVVELTIREDGVRHGRVQVALVGGEVQLSVVAARGGNVELLTRRGRMLAGVVTSGNWVEHPN